MSDLGMSVCLHFILYMCMLLYVILIQFSGFPEIYVQLEEGVCLT